MAIQLIGQSGTIQEIDSISQAGRSILYGSDGNPIVKRDRSSLGVTPGSTNGLVIMGADYKTPIMARSVSDGSLVVGDRTLLLYDRGEGAAVDTNKWIQTTTTMTITQGTGVITFNAALTSTTTTGAMHTSHRMFPFLNRTVLIMRVRARHTAHTNNNVIEMGFGSPASATAASIGNGACWRKNAAGDYIPVVSINGVETVGNSLSQATILDKIPATDYANFEVVVYTNRVGFMILTSEGEIVSSQIVDFPGNSTSFQVTHLQAFLRLYNSGGVSPAVQMLVDDFVVWASDYTPNKDWSDVLAGMNYSSLTSPTAYTQLANWSNSAAPTTRALSNTTAAESTLGGLLVASSIAGGNTDLIMFAFQVPSPYTFHFTGIRFDAPLNQGAAVATSPTIFMYGMAFNSSAVSLATAGAYPPHRVALGGPHIGAVGLAANNQLSGQPIVWTPPTPIAVQPGRFIHLFCRQITGAATAAETYFWCVQFNGYFE